MAYRRALPVLALPLILLASCVQEAAVDVARHGGAVAFTVTRAGADSPPCVKNVSVSKDGTDIGDTPPVWELATAEAGRCRTGFTYGEVPAGYSQGAAAPALAPGTHYLVEVSGPGFMGGSRFAMRADDGPMNEPTP